MGKNKNLYKNEICSSFINANGFQLRRLRLNKGWTQRRTAEKLSVYLGQTYRLQQVQKYEWGIDKMTGLVLFALSKIFEVKMETFFESELDFKQRILFEQTLDKDGKVKLSGA